MYSDYPQCCPSSCVESADLLNYLTKIFENMDDFTSFVADLLLGTPLSFFESIFH